MQKKENRTNLFAIGKRERDIKLSAKYSVCTKNSEAVVRRCFAKQVFLEITQNSQERTCASVPFSKVEDWRLHLQKTASEYIWTVRI